MGSLKKFKSNLFIGPMSKNCVDACVNFNKKNKAKIYLIASRRQIETKFFGSGYVNNWSTESLSRYIKKKKLNLCRDHGGPWQGSHEVNKKQSLSKAMRRAKFSFEQDIKNNFKIIHIDTSINPTKITIDEKIKRAKELLKFCSIKEKKYKKKIEYEIGWESEKGEIHNFKELKKMINEICVFCKIENIKKPKFITLKTGTKVFEDRNIGSLSKFIKDKKKFNKKIRFLKSCINLCHENGFLVKEHNADYMDYKFLKLRPKLKIDGVNIAPEFGTYETKIIFDLLVKKNLLNEKKELERLFLNSKKWKKWTKKNSKISKIKKAILAGHYLYTNKNFMLIKKKLTNKLKRENKINLDKYIIKLLTAKISLFAKSLNLN